MIIEKDGRSRSIRTPEEDIEALQKEMEGLSPAEREAFQLILDEFQHPPPDPSTSLLHYLNEAEYKTPPVDMRTFIKDPYFLGNTCDNLYPKLLDDLVELFEGGYHEVIYTGCIELDALVQSANGSLRTIREWIGSAGEVVGFREDGTAYAKTGVAKHSGTLPVVSLELANGMKQRLTPDHKVMAWRDGYEWTPAGELVPGDFVVIARMLPTKSDSSLSEDEAKLLAYWCADGSSSEQRSRFCDGNPATTKEVVDLLKTLGFAGKREPKGENCWEVYVEEHKRSGFLAWLRSHDAHLPTKDVVVPDAVCRGNNSVVSSFLNRLWAAEGTVYANAAKSPPRFMLSMTSERFVRQVQLLLLRHGIASRLQFTPQYDKRSGKTTESWILSVQGVGPLMRFCAFVGPILGKEEAYQKLLSYVLSTKENTNVDIIPVKRKWLSEEMTRQGLVRAASSRWWGLARGTGAYLSRRMFEEWLQEYGDSPLGLELVARFPREYAFERVEDLFPAGEAEVGDICDVEKIHSFISNGIYSHNSIGWGKCLHGSTEIFDPVSGRRRRVDELGDLHVVSMAEGGKIETRPATAFASGRKKCLEIRLAAGQKITLSADHKVFTARGWVEARDLVSDDLVATPRLVPAPVSAGTCVHTDDEVKLCAYLMADGGCTAGITFTNETETVLEEFVEVVGRTGKTRKGLEPRAVPAKHQHAGKATTLNVRGVSALVQQWGINDTSREKRLPAEFYGLSRDHVRLFLNRFWACDGSLSVAAPQKVEVTLASEGLINDLVFLLLRLGIPSRKVAKEKFYRTPDGTKKAFPAWCLTVTGADNLLLFLAEVGPILGKEAACAALQDACSSIKPNTNTDVVPVGLAELRRIRAQLGDQGTNLTSRFPCPEGQLLSRSKFERLCAAFDYRGSFAWLATNDLRWERLVSIEDVGMHDVYDLSVPETHSFVGNGIVVHNTFTASIGIARILYELSCLKDPHKTYGLAKDTNISIVCLSVNETLATKVVFENISIKIKASPYFQECFPFDATKKELRFPNNVWVAARATTDTSALGLNTISGLVDETNFMATTKTSRNAGLGGYVDHAEVIYNAIKRRMKSRFEKKGKLPGMLFIVSSKKTQDDFTARRVRESQNDPSVFVRDYALWDVKQENFTSKKFWVIVGNDQTPSRILTDEDEAKLIAPTLPEGVVLIDVPEDFRPDFERDLEGAIRDLAGCATVAISPYIQRRDKILQAVDPVRNHPFSVQTFDPSKPDGFLWEYLVKPTQERDLTGSMVTTLRPVVNPTAARHIHIDPSLTGDATGFAMSHICGWKDVRRRGEDGQEYLERAPLYFVDFLLQIIPPIGDEIILGDVRRLVYDLTAHGYMITNVTMDSWQSADALQQLSQRGYNSGLLSMDTSMDPYDNLKTALYENRIVFYHYPPLIKELQQLERDSKRRKVDHPPRGSKDVSDALAGSIFTLSQQRSTQPLPILRGSAYYGDSWMSEQRQSLSPSSSSNQNLHGDMPLPILGGRNGNGGEGW